MMKKYLIILAPVLLLFVFIFPKDAIQVSASSLLEIGQVRSLGEQAKVPVILHDMDYLTSAQLTITLPAEAEGVTLKSFEPSDLFNGEVFRTTGHIADKRITIDVISQKGDAVRMIDHKANKEVVMGYITYDLSEDFYPGAVVPLQITKVVATGRNQDIIFEKLDGEISHKMPIGDVVGNNGASVAGAMRVLQHINGNFITDEEQRLSADVDADGELTQMDAQQILDYATGKRSTFLAIAAQDLTNGVLKSEYRATIEARHGRAPYKFALKSSSIPSGLILNGETGELKGVPARAGEYKFDIGVTDAVGNKAVRTFTLNIIDSNIVSVETIAPINVKRGEIPNLPSQVKVTYKDKTIGLENVTWDPVDTSVLRTVTAKGTVGDSGFTVKATVNVVNENYIKNIKIGYFQLLNAHIHTIVVDTTPDVYTVTVDNIPTHYEGNDQFSLASASFGAGSSVTIRLYDKYGNLLETKVQKLEVN